MIVWIAFAVLVLVYAGIWWAISRIPKTYTPVVPPKHMSMQHPDRLRMDLHDSKDMEL